MFGLSRAGAVTHILEPLKYKLGADLARERERGRDNARLGKSGSRDLNFATT